MPTIAIVDDRHDPRVTLRRAISLHAPEGWTVIDSAPLGEMAEYPSWLIENEVAVLVLDENLREQTQDAEGHALYQGHEVVDYLRARIPTLPIFFVTSYPNEPELDDRFGKVEGIFARGDFADKAKDHVERIVRGGQRYLETNETELADLARLSSRIAEGRGSEADYSKLEAIRGKLGLAFQESGVVDRSVWIAEMENGLEKLEHLRNQIEDFLKGAGLEVEKDFKGKL